MRRVVITAMGVIAPTGIGSDAFWQGTCSGHSFIEADPEMQAMKIRSKVNSRLHDFSLPACSHKLGINLDALYPDLAQHDRYVQFGVAASEMALMQANLRVDHDMDQTGFVFSSAIGGTPHIQKIYEQCADGGAGNLQYRATGATFYNSGMYNHVPAQIAARHGLGGEVVSLSTGCTAGLDAMGLATALIASGQADMMLAGASEAPLASLTYATLDVINSLSTADGSPATRSRPFDATRAGFVIGEGAVTLVLEEYEAARRRGAVILAEVNSFYSMNNGTHMTNLPSDGLPMVHVLKRLFAAGGLTPHAVDYINAHGSSTPQNDVFETNAYKEIFGAKAYHIPISSTKSMIGHSLSSASLLGVAAAIGALVHGRIHPTANLTQPDPLCDLDYVPGSMREQAVRTALVTASGFGGIHSAALLTKVEN